MIGVPLPTLENALQCLQVCSVMDNFPTRSTLYFFYLPEIQKLVSQLKLVLFWKWSETAAKTMTLAPSAS